MSSQDEVLAILDQVQAVLERPDLISKYQLLRHLELLRVRFLSGEPLREPIVAEPEPEPEPPPKQEFENRASHFDLEAAISDMDEEGGAIDPGYEVVSAPEQSAPALVEEPAEQERLPEPPVKRGPGRPRKNP